MSTQPPATPQQLRVHESLDALLLEATTANAGHVLLDFFEQGRQVTYGDFAELVSRAAGRLLRAGVRDGDRVGVMLPNEPLFAAMMFAVPRVGAVVVPLNPGFRPSELDYVAEDCGISALVTDAETLHRQKSSGLTRRLQGSPGLLLSDDFGTDSDDLGEQGRAPRHDVDNTMVAIQYTSGSTGFPKGCMLTHRYWTQAAAVYADFAGHPKRVLCDSPFFYMSGPGWLLTAMASGGTAFVPDKPSLHRFVGWLRELAIDFCWFPDQLLAFPESPDDGRHPCRHAFVDHVPTGRLSTLEQRFNIMVRDCYAMTETGTGTFVPWDDQEGAYAGSMGIPSRFRECKIVDDDLRDVVGEAQGELCVRGPGMFLGYYGREDLNAELFLPGGWFRTGDRVRRDAQGRYYFLGRARDVVRRNGENISAQEVEHVLRAIPGVVEVGVVPVPDEMRGEEVKAYIVLAEGVDAVVLSPARIAEICSERLAAFKVPRFIEYRDQLPMTPSEKVAKRALIDETEDLRAGAFDLVHGVWL
jgi:acyl-CoA synthetase (AMP-forming)/AMP-acid ligase II